MSKKVTYPTFKLGDWVIWTSQAAGFSKEKIGEIIEIVPKGRLPQVGQGLGRDHESYVVKVKGRGKYWPIVSKLTLHTGPRHEDVVSSGAPTTVSDMPAVEAPPEAKPDLRAPPGAADNTPIPAA